MLDIDLLDGARLPAKRDIIYVYRSGLVRRRVRSMIKEVLEHEGYVVTEIGEEGIASAPFTHSILAPFNESALICDVTRTAPSNGWYKGLDTWLNAIASGKRILHRLCLIIPAHSAGMKLVIWAPAVAASTFIEEPEVTSASADHVLNFLMADSKLFDFSRLKGKRKLRKAFQDAADSQKRSWSLEEASRALEDFCFSCIDPVTNTFELTFESGSGIRKSQPPFELHRRLAEFLVEKTDPTQAALLLLMDHRLHFQKLDQNVLASQLHKATQDLAAYSAWKAGKTTALDALEITKYQISRMEGLRQVVEEDMKLWEVTLGRSTSELERGNLLFAFERLCRRYISRRDLARTFVPSLDRTYSLA